MSRRIWPAVAIVAATYVYFLIFAEFAFLALAQQVADADGVLNIMGGLGAGGVAGSALAAATFSREQWRVRLRGWFAACAVFAGLAAMLSGAVDGWRVWAALGFIVGVSLGGLTVTLASGLRTVAGPRLGWVCGLGTGLAYAICNLPGVFSVSPVAQTWIAVLAVVAGVVSTYALTDGAEVVAADDFSGSWWRWVVALAALVWMDSAAFAVIQHESSLRTATWTGDCRLVMNACVHLAAAIWTGWALQLRCLRAVAWLAWALLAGACVALAWKKGEAAGGAAWPYIAGVSLYSALLVYVPARLGRPWVAAAVYAISGWIGSALGIGMAQGLSSIPVWFAPVSGVVLGLAMVWRWRLLRQPVAVVALILATCIGVKADPIARGREVYIAEGCIHCHSQYVRPGTLDVVWWGPARPLDAAVTDRPPLYGNRRQGPDLTNVGNRRSPEWNRIHLQAPRTLVRSSRMPAYAYLFRGDDSRGNDLVEYLASLGAETEAERREAVSVWTPEIAEADILKIDATKLFGSLCAPCHGTNGRGDGMVAATLVVPPRDFALGWRRIQGTKAEVARTIKFGVSGTPMAGHETLTDAEVVSLARLVVALHDAGNTP